MSGHDPGWNDPPKISYDRGCEISSAAPSKRISLNKRVAVPMNFVPSNSGNDPTIPPPPLDIKKIAPPPMGSPPKTGFLPPPTGKEPVEVPSENLRDRLPEVVNNIRLGGGADDSEVMKRISVMENLWLDGKLEPSVQRRIIELSIALKSRDVDEADRIQKGLMVDHLSQCSSWMGAVRQLINTARSSRKEEGEERP